MKLFSLHFGKELQGGTLGSLHDHKDLILEPLGPVYEKLFSGVEIVYFLESLLFHYKKFGARKSGIFGNRTRGLLNAGQT